MNRNIHRSHGAGGGPADRGDSTREPPRKRGERYGCHRTAGRVVPPAPARGRRGRAAIVVPRMGQGQGHQCPRAPPPRPRAIAPRRRLRAEGDRAGSSQLCQEWRRRAKDPTRRMRGHTRLHRLRSRARARARPRLHHGPEIVGAVDMPRRRRDALLSTFRIRALESFNHRAVGLVADGGVHGDGHRLRAPFPPRHRQPGCGVQAGLWQVGARGVRRQGRGAREFQPRDSGRRAGGAHDAHRRRGGVRPVG